MRIGRYEVIEELGRGGMGAVYRGRDPETGQEVAIKILLKGRDASPHQRTRFDREVRALAKVEHPNVVRLLGVGEERGAPFLVMAYHQRGSLEDMLKTSLLSPDLVVSLGIQLAAGLAAAHAEGVLHRDLKPENVLLGANGSVLLTDFGLAKDLSREGETQALTQSGMFQGTPGFWAPEQAEGRLSEVSPKTDVYGLGAILYAALSGRPPIVGEGLIAILAATTSERPPALRSLRADVSPALEAVVMRCLEKDASARWGSASELKQALVECVERLEVSPRPLRLRSWFASAGVVALLAGAFLLLAGLWRARTPQPPASPSASALYERGLVDWHAERLRESGALFRAAAEQGHTQAMYKLGSMLSTGQGVTQDEAEAAEWYRGAAEKGHPQAMANLGLALERGRGVTQDEAEAVEWYRRAAEKGNSGAMVNLGFMLSTGQGVTQDEAEAAEWYRRAAEKGQPQAMANLGVALERGRGVAQDQAQAVEWYRRAADKGHSGAMAGLGFMLSRGRGVAQDEAQAAEWYRRAAEKGRIEAMFSLGEMLERGRGATQDVAQAVEWYRRAAEKGHPGAMVALGALYATGQGGMSQDAAQAVEWYRRAAEKGHTEGMVGLGFLLEKGLGVAQDEAQAVEWYRRAAEKGRSRGMVRLGFLLEKGLGVAQDEAQAVEWYRRAAENGNLEGMFSLGGMLETGRGVTQDVVQAVEWYRRAAQGESARIRALAKAALERLGRSRR
ncbi:MAG: SEL1-like repeat protein [Planctomycetes bacterium]|nr:SEL1-like repeat protein [Planctomycetota bacterium]